MKTNTEKKVKNDSRVKKERKSKVRLLSITAVLVVLLFLFFLWAEREYVNRDIDEEVVVVKEDIEEYTLITEDNFDKYLNIDKVRSSNIPVGGISDKELVIGKYITRDYIQNEIISDKFLSDSDNEYRSSIDTPIYVSASVNSLESAVSGTIKEGDYVDILIYNSDSITKQVYLNRKYQNVRVIEAFNADGNNEDGSSTLLFTFLIDEDDEDQFITDVRNGNVRIARRNYETGGYEVISY